MLLQVHLADDLVVAGPVEGLPIVVARQLLVLARSVLVARAVWGGPGTLHLTVPPEDKEALGVVDEDPVAALTHRELAQVLCAGAASGAARVYCAVGDGHLLNVADGKRHRTPEPWLSGCQVLSGDLSGCRALSGTVRCLCQTSCQVLSVLSGAVGCVSDRRGDL